MVLYLLVFLAGGFIGILLMSMLCLGGKEDERCSEAYEKLKFSHDNPGRACSVDAMAAEAD
jgi:hypothetical protein